MGLGPPVSNVRLVTSIVAAVAVAAVGVSATAEKPERARRARLGETRTCLAVETEATALHRPLAIGHRRVAGGSAGGGSAGGSASLSTPTSTRRTVQLVDQVLVGFLVHFARSMTSLECLFRRLETVGVARR